METFKQAREFVEHISYGSDRKQAMLTLDPAIIDVPILDVVQDFAELPYCFTLQSCFGHFMWDGQSDPRSLGAIPKRDAGLVTYNIAYVALCIEHCAAGVRLRKFLDEIRVIDSGYVQFGSPDWYWNQYPNSYALQVEPERYKLHDRAEVPHSEALQIQAIRDQCFVRIRKILDEAKQELRATC